MDNDKYCTMELHEKTQKEWEGRTTEYLLRIEGEVTNIKEKFKSQKETLEKMERKYDAMCDKHDDGQKDLTEIKIMQAKILEQLTNKDKKDSVRNGKVKELRDKESDLSKTVATHGVLIEGVMDMQDKIWALLKQIAVGFILFFITFFVKTFVWGF